MSDSTFLPNKKRRIEMENNQDLSQDTLELILGKVPLKPRTRFKCVSKAWNASIAHLRRTQPPTTTSGLVFSIRKQLNLLEVVQDQTENNNFFMHNMTTSLTHNLPWLIDSCNGLLLFCEKDGISLSYHVSSPMKNQWLKLPHGHDFSRSTSASLAFDGVQQHFKIICQFWEEADIKNGILKYQIFSSESWEWREFNTKLPNSGLLVKKDFNSDEWVCPSLYSKGKLYWIWSLYLLVFNEGEQSFGLIELPKVKNKNMISLFCGKRLWESEDHLHYCDSIDVGLFYIWECIDNSPNYGLWRLKRCIRLNELVVFRIHDDRVLSISPVTVKPCGFNEDLHVLYFQLPGFIVAYSFETRKAVRVYSDNAIGQSMNDHVYPFLFKAVDLDGLITSRT